MAFDRKCVWLIFICMNQLVIHFSVLYLILNYVVGGGGGWGLFLLVSSIFFLFFFVDF